MKEILNVIHNTIYQFFDVCNDDEEVPMSDKDKLLLEVNKAICNNLKTLEQQPHEEDILKFYYVESLDDYWIGKRADTMYYAEWDDLQGFVLMYSRYLPWGKHVVEPNTLWKECTYPSEPKEIPFGKWIKGFLKKHGKEPTVLEDAISRQAVLEKAINVPIARVVTEDKVICRKVVFADDIEQLPSVTPQSKTGRWMRWYEVIENADGKSTDYIPHCKCAECGTEYDPHSSQFIKYCHNCGAMMQEVENDGE